MCVVWRTLHSRCSQWRTYVRIMWIEVSQLKTTTWVWHQSNLRTYVSTYVRMCVVWRTLQSRCTQLSNGLYDEVIPIIPFHYDTHPCQISRVIAQHWPRVIEYRNSWNWELDIHSLHTYVCTCIIWYCFLYLRALHWRRTTYLATMPSSTKSPRLVSGSLEQYTNVLIV